MFNARQMNEIASQPWYMRHIIEAARQGKFEIEKLSFTSREQALDAYHTLVDKGFRCFRIKEKDNQFGIDYYFMVSWKEGNVSQ